MKKILSIIVLLLALSGTALAAFIPITPTQNITVENITTTTVNGVLIKNNVAMYVNGSTGSDTTGDGTATLPFATVVKGLTELVKYQSPNTMYLYIADGTYTETINVPRELTGVISIIGNLSHPENVILAAAAPASNIFTATGPAKFYVSGIQFQGATASAAIFADRGDVSIFYNKFVNNKTAASAYNNSKVNFYDSSYGDSTIDCNNIAYSIGLASQFDSVLNFGQTPTISNCVTGILNRTSSLYMSYGGSISASNSDFLLERGSYTYLAGTFTLDGVTSTGSNKIFNIAQSELDIAGSSVLNFTNSYFGFFGYTGVKIIEIGSVTYNYTGITTKAYLDYDTVIDGYSGTMLNAVPLYYNGASDYGYDGRYYRMAKQKTVTTSTYTVEAAYGMINVNYSSTGACTITIPSSLISRANWNVTIKDSGFLAGTNHITIETEGSETIDGASNYVIDYNKGSIFLYSNGTNLLVI